MTERKEKRKKNRNLLLLRFPRDMDVDAILAPRDGPGAEMDPRGQDGPPERPEVLGEELRLEGRGS